MIDITSITDLELLRESVDLECKLAAGRDGRGAVPEDFWPTYSAFANTEGGVVVFGLREKKGQFLLEGVLDPPKVRKELFDALNNRNKVSVNLLSDASVQEATIDGKVILVVQIPAATRKQQPVFLNGQPFNNTYRRLNDGDRRCDDETVKRMLAEQVEDSLTRVFAIVLVLMTWTWRVCTLTVTSLLAISQGIRGWLWTMLSFCVCWARGGQTEVRARVG